MKCNDVINSLYDTNSTLLGWFFKSLFLNLILTVILILKVI